MSPAFHFALQPLLEHYEAMECYARSELGITQRRFADAMCEGKRLRAELTNAANVLAQPHSIDASLYYAHVERMHGAMQQQGKIISSCGAEVERSRQIFIAANKKRKVLEQLKTRRADAHLLREQLSEQREVDESNLCVYKSGWRGHSCQQMPRSPNIRADKWT